MAEKGIAEFAVVARALAGRARFPWVGPDDPDKPDRVVGAEEGVAFVGFRDDIPERDAPEADQSTPMSSFHRSGCSAMKPAMSAAHSWSSRSTTSTPWARSRSSAPRNVRFSPMTTRGIP